MRLLFRARVLPCLGFALLPLLTLAVPAQATPPSAPLSGREAVLEAVFGGFAASFESQASRPDGVRQGRDGADVPAAPLARAGGVELLSLSSRTVAVGLHEAGSSASLPLRPASAAGAVMMPSRGRGTGPTTAMDVAVEPGAQVRAPVSGTVVVAAGYRLYGKVDDELAVVETPSGRQVRLLHLDGLQVSEGDRVVAGVTPVADRARLLPFGSQIDRWAGRVPHVHVEVR